MAFTNAQQVDASHGVFNEVRGNQIISYTNTQGTDTYIINSAQLSDSLDSLLDFRPSFTESALRNLYNLSAIGAAFDSAEHYPATKCLHGTQEAVIAVITNILSNSSGPRICWLHGMTGSGKSAVAQSIAEHLGCHGQLAASFFFSRGTTMRSQAKYIFPMIALQLTVSIPSLKSSIIDTLHDDPFILDKGLRYQL